MFFTTPSQQYQSTEGNTTNLLSSPKNPTKMDFFVNATGRQSRIRRDARASVRQGLQSISTDVVTGRTASIQNTPGTSSSSGMRLRGILKKTPASLHSIRLGNTGPFSLSSLSSLKCVHCAVSHPSDWRPLEVCCQPWTWWCNDATALAGCATTMMIVLVTQALCKFFGRCVVLAISKLVC